MYKKLLAIMLLAGFAVTSVLAQNNDNLTLRKTTKPVNNINQPSMGSLFSDVLTITAGGVSFDVVRVKAGTFVMGCTDEMEGDCYGDENPSHSVTISQDYYIGKFEVTQDLFEAVMGYNPSKWQAPNLPVENVRWDEAQEFCNKLSRMTGRRFALPTEAQWEYAARGGKKTVGYKYSGGSYIWDVAWYIDNSNRQTHPVGRLRPNELGLYDMSGNVWEWCQDWYGDYSSSSQRDPQGPDSGSIHVLRGGGWDLDTKSIRVANRGHFASDFDSGYYGFRIVMMQ